MTARGFKLAGLTAVVLATSAHVGSPDVYFDGMAGPYAVHVVVRTPGVVPGQADVIVRTAEAVTTVSAVPVFWNIGLKGAPPPDTAVAVAPGLYDARLWLMRGGPYSIYVTVAGPAGHGTVIVPVVAVATQRLAFERPMAMGLIGAGLFLLIGAITILRAAARESTVAAGETPSRAQARRGWITAGASGVALVTVVWLGRSWWNAEDARYQRTLYRPWQTEASVSGGVLTLRVTDTIWKFRAPLIPDHGKLMHLFLVYEGQDAFAHLHPTAPDSTAFTALLPAMPAGRYHAFADVAFETGGTRTLTTELHLANATPAGRFSDPDDATWVATAPGLGDTTARLGDGLTMTWTRPRTVAVDSGDVLRFTVRDATGAVAQLEPYMGMAAHAVVMRDDAAVFIHLHPAGTISIAAQEAFELRQPGDTTLGAVGRRVTAAQAAHPMAMSAAGEFSFPYAFPQPGRYRIWVQVKHRNTVLTGAYATDVR